MEYRLLAKRLLQERNELTKSWLKKRQSCVFTQKNLKKWFLAAAIFKDLRIVYFHKELKKDV